MNKLDCKIIQDLLSNYVEDLTSKETNEFIENHLKECKECKKAEEIMKKGMKEEESKAKNQINYLKKYKRKMVALKATISFVIIFVLVFLGIKVYQYQFLAKLYEHNVQYEMGNNFKLISRDGNTGAIIETTYKDGVGLVKLNNRGSIWEDENSKYMIIENAKQYMEIDKTDPPLGIDSKITIGTYGIFNLDNKGELFKLILTKGVDIHEEEYGEHQCYVILYEGEKLWIDKESLFIIRDDFEGQTTEYFIEVNTVTDKDVQKPNLEGYTKIK